MKAFVFSDLHGNYRQLHNIESYLCENKIDLILFAGDLTNMGEPIEFVDLFLKMLDEVKIPIFWVPGNNDFGRGYYRLAARYPSLEGRVMEFPLKANSSDPATRFSGVGGSPESWAGQYQGETTDQKIEIGGTVFLSHVPPPCIVTLNPYDDEIANPKKQIPDKFQFSNDQMRNGKINERCKMKTGKLFKDAPFAHICGHLHSRQGVGYIGQTKIIKLAAAERGNYAILDLETLKVEFRRFR